MSTARQARQVRPATADPLAGVERVYVDGTNLLHAVARGGERAPGSAVVAGIRAAFPPEVIVDLVFDGPPSGGLKGRVASGMRVAYSGRVPADKVIADGVGEQLRADGPSSTWGILVVTDDRGLRDIVRRLGARTAAATWLAGRLARETVGAPRPRAGTTLGHARPPRPRSDGADDTR